MKANKIITIDPGKRSGEPCIGGLRITVHDIFDYLASGMIPEAIIEDFPELNMNNIHAACYKFAAACERRLFTA